ncbi:uncharacterized protein LOC108681826 [Hyalella azteca]|uniref:Uncharacterized protein LOC108681826 n=1 Tax=Hyalella azteca TaxID=294128 RepID=A0A8B7PLV8_HYAAZ|nr:uncharacterized protein LOC108681826 [Hyalella azteca]
MKSVETPFISFTRLSRSSTLLAHNRTGLRKLHPSYPDKNICRLQESPCFTSSRIKSARGCPKKMTINSCDMELLEGVTHEQRAQCSTMSSKVCQETMTKFCQRTKPKIFRRTKTEGLAFLSVALLMALMMSLGLSSAQEDADVAELSAASDFNGVQLQWRYPRRGRGPSLFKITHCEDQAWGPHRCRNIMLNPNEVTQTPLSDGSVQYSSKISHLRMATNYTIEVTPVDQHDQNPEVGGQRVPSPKGRAIPDEGHRAQVFVQTKGFSARALSCLTNSTQIQVETGPHFGGKVRGGAVNVSLPEDPEASKVVPVDQSVNEVDPSELFDSSDNLVNRRLGARRSGKALKLEQDAAPETGPRMWTQLVLMLVMVVGAVVGLSCAFWHFGKHAGFTAWKKNAGPDIETLSPTTEDLENIERASSAENSSENSGTSAAPPSSGMQNSPLEDDEFRLDQLTSADFTAVNPSMQHTSTDLTAVNCRPNAHSSDPQSSLLNSTISEGDESLGFNSLMGKICASGVVSPSVDAMLKNSEKVDAELQSCAELQWEKFDENHGEDEAPILV